MKIKPDFDYIIREVEFRTGEVINLTKLIHVATLNEVLHEYGIGAIAAELLSNLHEGPNDGDNKKTEKDVEKEEEYKGVGGSMFVKAMDFIEDAKAGEPNFKAGAQQYKKDGDKYTKVSGDDESTTDKPSSSDIDSTDTSNGDQETEAPSVNIFKSDQATLDRYEDEIQVASDDDDDTDSTITKPVEAIV